MNTVAVRWEEGVQYDPIVEVHAADAGLAVTGPIKPFDSYTVTHVASGQAVWPPLSVMKPRDAATAERAMRAALASGVDWTQPVDAIKAQLSQAEIKTLMHKMRLAAYPPRRSWWASPQRRRWKPYKAASKREAIRQSRECEMPRLWQDIWAWRKRGEMWGMIAPVVRQPYPGRKVTKEDRAND